jgi:membrane-associated protein
MNHFNSFTEFLQFIGNPEDIISKGGLIAIGLIIFAETGLFFCFFLPGDYLLFLAGLYCTSVLKVHIALLFAVICGAAIIGNYTAYFFGKIVGETLYQRKDSLFFKRRYMDSTKELFIRYGGKSLVIGRFMPIIRTFAPILAGTAQMNFREFTIYNVVGGFLWTFILVLGGYFLGYEFPNLKEHVEYVIFFFIGITSLTVIRTYLKIRKEQMEAEKHEKNDKNNTKNS